jgi:hypothetical protein
MWFWIEVALEYLKLNAKYRPKELREGMKLAISYGEIT